MNNSTKNYTSGHFVLLFFLLLGCSKQKEHPGLTPSPFKASFKIYESILGLKRFETDTIVNYQADFTAPDNYDSYEWAIGSDPTKHKVNSFHLNFPLSVTGTTIPVTLIASKNGQWDTLQKAFTVMAVKGTITESLTPYTILLNYLGKYKGSYEDAPKENFVVSIVNFGAEPPINNDSFFYGFRVYNLPQGCGADYKAGQSCILADLSPVHYAYPFEYSYKAFYVNDGYGMSCCQPAILWGYLDSVDRNKLIVECDFQSTDPAGHILSTKRRFVGNRL